MQHGRDIKKDCITPPHAPHHCVKPSMAGVSTAFKKDIFSRIFCDMSPASDTTCKELKRWG